MILGFAFLGVWLILFPAALALCDSKSRPPLQAPSNVKVIK